MSKIAAYVKLLRIPGIAGLATPTVIGALSVGVYDPFTLLILFIIGALMASYGFILNDFADVELDSLVKELHGKPLVDGDISTKNAAAISVFFILLSFFFVFLLWRGQPFNGYKFMAAVCIVLAGLFGAFYDFYGKKIAGSDFFLAISISFIFLFGALSVGKPTDITWIIFLLTFNQSLHMNAVEGGIKDADHDYKMGVSNLALASGVKVKGDHITIPRSFQVFSMAIRLWSACLLFIPFFLLGYSYQLWQLVILGLATFGVLYLNYRLLVLTVFDRSRIQKLIGTQSFLRYSLVPLMLLPILTTYFYPLFLIVLPIAWYMIFTSFVGEKLFKPRM
jgi:4-hydroxybenzoate polyprenyltransferase